MNSEEAFRRFGHDIETDPIGMLLAEWQRSAFIHALKQLPDVVDVIPAGSLARGTQIGPVHDVDLIVVFDSSAYPDWGYGSESALVAMQHLQASLLQQMHPWRGTDEGLFEETKIRNHVVQCNGVSTGPFEGFVPSVPPVDVMPAVQHHGHLRVPELHREGLNLLGKNWIDVDPEKFMHLIEQRQRDWKYFKAVIKLVKAWAEEQGLKIKSMAIEVMVLKYCPRPGLFETLTVSEAVTRFFEAAAKANIHSLTDPTGWCGEIDRHMNYGALRNALKEAAGLSRRALDAERAVDRGQSILGDDDPGSLWRKLFGKKFPHVKKRFWPAQHYEPWTDFTRWSAWTYLDFDPFDPNDQNPNNPPRWDPPDNGGGPGAARTTRAGRRRGQGSIRRVNRPRPAVRHPIPEPIRPALPTPWHRANAMSMVPVLARRAIHPSRDQRKLRRRKIRCRAPGTRCSLTRWLPR